MDDRSAVLDRRSLLRGAAFTLLGLFTHRDGLASLTAPSIDTTIPSPELGEVCLSQPSCGKVLHHLYARPTTLMTVPDVAGCVEVSLQDAQSAMEKLHGMGFLRRVAIGSLVFYGLTDDTRQMEVVKSFQDWCAIQRRHWDALRRVVV
jgi:hypothetical protein